MSIRIAHEAPKTLFREVQAVTDYDYCLVHLLEEDPEYLSLFKQAIEEGREVILDNSIFELEEAFDSDKFTYWINEMKPTWYIVPDVLESAQGTVDKMQEWLSTYRDKVTGRMIGVVQGETYSELANCYEYMVNFAKVDMVAISFDYSYYEDLFPHENKHVSWAIGRFAFINRLYKEGVINTSVPHHLLGVSLPIEGQLYPKSWEWLYSIDTSNPVVHGLKEVTYIPNLGLRTKYSQKLFTLINEDPTSVQKEAIFHNIEQFRKFWKDSDYRF